MNVIPLAIGVVFGLLLFAGAAMFLGIHPPQSPAELCNEQLAGDGWEPVGATAKSGSDVEIICAKGNTTETVAAANVQGYAEYLNRSA